MVSKQRSAFSFVLLFCVLVFFSQCLWAKTVEVTIFHTNDWHGTVDSSPAFWLTKANPPLMGGPGVLSSFWKKEKLATLRRGGRYLVLDSGDRFQGSLEVNLSKGKIMTPLYNALGYRLVALGNHDLDYGQKALVDAQKGAEFSLLCSNMEGPDAAWRKSMILSVNGIRVGLFALLTEDMPTLTFPENLAGLRILSAKQTARQMIRTFKSKKCDYIVLLSHCGHPIDERLAREVPEIDLIIGGHTEENLEQPEMIGTTMIVQTRGYGSHAGVLNLQFETDQKRLTGYRYRNLPLDPTKFSPDPAIANLLKESATEVDALASQFIAPLSCDWLRNEVNETNNLGTHITKAIQEVGKIQVALFHLGGVRSDLSAGRLTFRDVYQVLPFDHQILTGEVTGAQLLEIVKKARDGKGAELYIAGIKGNQASDGPILPDKKYSIAFNDFLAAGGDGWTEFKAVPNTRPTGILVRDAFIEYLKKHQGKGL